MRITVEVAAFRAGSKKALAESLFVNESTVHRWNKYLPTKYAKMFAALYDPETGKLNKAAEKP